MKNIILVLALFISALAGCKNTPSVKKDKFTNPVIYADVPDMDIIRVGNDYYMVSTTMHLMPGAPIMRSKDLVNWEIISYLFDEIKDSPFYDLEGGNIYGQGQWASSLRYHNGKFYVLFATNRPQRTYIYETEDPTGKWKKISEFDKNFHDASLLFDDDGKVYLAYGSGQIRITELKSDLSDIKPDGLDVVVIKGKEDGFPNLLEGTHLYKYNDKYYMFLIWWPQGGIRIQLCFRSDQIGGPYESKVILSDFMDRPGAGVAQGAIIDTEDGDWYGFLFQDRGAVGRVPILMPCRWEDGWPILGNEEGKVPKVMEILVAPIVKAQYTPEKIVKVNEEEGWNRDSAKDADGNMIVDFTAKKRSQVYLPTGTTWYDFWTNQQYKGGQRIELETSIDNTPLFIKAGSIIPFGPKVQYATEKQWDHLQLRIYTGADGAFVLYEDEFDNYNYEKGEYTEIPITWNNASRTLIIGDRKGSYKGMLLSRKFTILLQDATEKTVEYDGNKLEVN